MPGAKKRKYDQLGTLHQTGQSVQIANRGSKSTEIILLTAKALGFEGFDYPDIQSVYDDYKQLSAHRLCDQSDQEYTTLSYQWGGERLYQDERFATPSHKAQFHPVVSSAPKIELEHFVLLTGRTKKQWHTMTRTGLVPELLKSEEKPYLLMNTAEAEALGIQEGESVLLSNELDALRLDVRFGRLAPRHVFAPFGYPQVPVNSLIAVKMTLFLFKVLSQISTCLDQPLIKINYDFLF